MKKFKTRKKRNKIIPYIGLFLISIGVSIKYLYNDNLINENTFIDYLVNDNLVSEKTNPFKVEFLFKYTTNTELSKSTNVFKEELVEEEKKEFLSKDPIVYIFNTHQGEKYKNEYLDVYNINPTVFMASKILKEYLEDLGINVIVEENSLEDKLRSLGWKYGYSYKVSRIFLEEAVKENPTLKYFIDLHRDSSVYDKTTTEIDGEKFAKLLFVVGLDHDNYEPNLKLAEDLSEIIKTYNKDLYRGIMKKSGKGVNGIYNQDFSPNTMLVEVGGQYNNISEVNNTLKIFAQVLYDYIKGDLNG